MDLIERFRYIMKLNNMTASMFADEIGVQRSSVSHILSGRNKPSLEFIQKVIKRFPKVDSSWLISGSTSVTSVQEDVNDEGEVKYGSNAKDKREEDTGDSKRNETKKTISKVLIFYSDGTFEEFKSNH